MLRSILDRHRRLQPCLSGVHWPTDVNAGWLAGGIWALLCWFVMLWLQSRGEVEPEQPGHSRKA
jgi:membrane-associated phospholipid phosphatase